MDTDYIHIAINHFPIVGIFIGTCLLIYSVIANDKPLKHAAYSIILLTAIIIIPVYFSGAHAKSKLLIESPEVTTDILTHADFAITAVWLTLILGVFSYIGLYLSLKDQLFQKTSGIITVVLAIVILILLAITGYYGLAIHH